jgi:hypothetical protein
MECRDLRFYDDFTSVKRFPDAARRADCPLRKSIADVSCLRSRCGAHRKDRALAACPALRAFPKMLDLIQQHAVLAAQPAFELRDSGPTVAAFRVVASDHCRRALAQPVRRSNGCRASGIMGTTNILVPIPDAAKRLNLPPAVSPKECGSDPAIAAEAATTGSTAAQETTSSTARAYSCTTTLRRRRPARRPGDRLHAQALGRLYALPR